MYTRLTHRDYDISKDISAKGYPFYALMAAMMRQADTRNAAILRENWPGVWESLQRRYDAPLGVVEEWDGYTAQEYYGRLRAARSEMEENQDA